MKIATIAVMLLCILAILRMWTSREDAIARKLAAPSGVQVVTRSGSLDNTPLTTGTLKTLEKRFRTPISEFLSRQEILNGMSAAEISQQLSSSSHLVTDNGKQLAIFRWKMAVSNPTDRIFIVLAYGGHDDQTHRVLCLDRKPIDITGGRCGNMISSVFHMRIQDAVQ